MSRLGFVCPLDWMEEKKNSRFTTYAGLCFAFSSISTAFAFEKRFN